MSRLRVPTTWGIEPQPLSDLRRGISGLGLNSLKFPRQRYKRPVRVPVYASLEKKKMLGRGLLKRNVSHPDCRSQEACEAPSKCGSLIPPP